MAVALRRERPSYSPQVRALIDKYGEEGAFMLVDRARTGGTLSAEESAMLAGANLPETDREIEGGMTGVAILPAALAYEYGLKPAAKYVPGANRVLPEAFRYQEGVTSPSNWGNVAAAARGAEASGRVVPKAVEDMLREYVLGALMRKNNGSLR